MEWVEWSRGLQQKPVFKDHMIITSPHQSSSLHSHQPTFQLSSFAFQPQKSTHEEVSLHAGGMQMAKTMAGTQKLHFFKALSLNHLEGAIFSTSSMKREEVVTAQCDGLSLADVKGYVTAIYAGNWWLAYVTDVTPDNYETQLTFLHPQGPSPSYFYPRQSDTFHVHVSDILTRHPNN